MDSKDESRSSQDRDVIDFISKMTDAARQRIEENLPHGFVRLKVAEAERRQAQQDIRSVEDIVTELVRNSRDAGAKRVLVAFQKEQGRFRRITVIDDGRGIPADMHELVFEPRVTSKRDDFEEDRYGVHGRGMALFSIRSRSLSARVVSSVPGVGTAIAVNVDTRKVKERSDQATLPRLERAEDGEEIGSGPHNVARILLEMSLDCEGTEFYLGSFAEVLETAKFLAQSHPQEPSPWNSIASLEEAKALVKEADRRLGLSVSERNAYRVLNDEIAILENVLEQARLATGASGKVASRAPGSRARGGVRARSPLRKVTKDDLVEIGEECGRVIEPIISRYYLQSAGKPRVRRGRGKLIISFFVTGEEGEGD